MHNVFCGEYIRIVQIKDLSLKLAFSSAELRYFWLIDGSSLLKELQIINLINPCEVAYPGWLLRGRITFGESSDSDNMLPVQKLVFE